MAQKAQAWKVIHSSNDMAWRTPKALFEHLHNEFGFTLDAAANKENALVPNYLGKDHKDPKLHNSLTCHWKGVVFCNPPYGRQVGQWIKQAYEQSQQGATVVVLVMACTDTAWWHDYAWKADEIRLLRGRVRFTRSNGQKAAAAPKGSALLVFRPHTSLNTACNYTPRVISWKAPLGD